MLHLGLDGIFKESQICCIVCICLLSCFLYLGIHVFTLSLLMFCFFRSVLLLSLDSGLYFHCLVWCGGLVLGSVQFFFVHLSLNSQCALLVNLPRPLSPVAVCFPSRCLRLCSLSSLLKSVFFCWFLSGSLQKKFIAVFHRLVEHYTRSYHCSWPWT